MAVIRGMLARQFGATAQMLQEAITSCPERLWTTGSGGTEFLRLAYHTIFFLDFYLHRREADFSPPPCHREDAWDLEAKPAGEPYSKTTLLEYLYQVRKRAQAILADLAEDDLTAPSPVPWYTIQRGEFLLNSLRHAQHHVGQLNLILKANGETPSRWHGSSEQ
jgi:hypothetical protein